MRTYNKSIDRLSVRCIQDGSEAQASSSSGGYEGEYGSMEDERAGKVYKTIEAGKTWMAENLDFASGGKCYDDDPENCEKYGRLYGWEAAKTACPDGWHLPEYEEWESLFAEAGHAASLKAVSFGGTDESGFSALPGGYGYSGGSFNSVGNEGYWWGGVGGGGYILLSGNSYSYNRYGYNYLFSIRCVRN
jgi:uncharacterized protein (TIGR02145 family)